MLWLGLYKVKSLINIKNNIGPKTDPWGTTVFNVVTFEKVFEMDTTWCLSAKYEVNQWSEL